MYQSSKALFLYCVSPVHMGAGTALGLIDNPIQRERHTGHPLFAGSGLKGAMRHACKPLGWNDQWITRLFGPETANASDHAGAVSLGDAQLVVFPVRCTRSAFVYATSRVALARARRLLEHLDVDTGWDVPEVQEGFCRVVPGTALAAEGQPLHLEVFEHTAVAADELRGVADWLAEHALPSGEGYDFFREKLRTDLVLLPDEDFGHYVRNATVVEPHVRINDETGTADGGGLFYTENLPPESLLLAPVMASRERGDNASLEADAVMATLLQGPEGGVGFDGRLLQVGGDATTGRGQVVLSAVGGRN